MKTKSVKGGVSIQLTRADIRRVAEVVGTCKCGKPAQIVQGHTAPDGSMTFENVCHDCDAAKKAAPATRSALEKAAEYLCYLRDRWQDESEYEDFAEYQTAMSAFLPAGSTAVKLTKRPFRVEFKDASGQRRFIKVTRSGAEWGRIGPKVAQPVH